MKPGNISNIVINTECICMPRVRQITRNIGKHIFCILLAPQTPYKNVLMCTSQISTLVEDSHAEQDKIRSWNLSLRRRVVQMTHDSSSYFIAAYQLYSYLLWASFCTSNSSAVHHTMVWDTWHQWGITSMLQQNGPWRQTIDNVVLYLGLETYQLSYPVHVTGST